MKGFMTLVALADWVVVLSSWMTELVGPGIIEASSGNHFPHPIVHSQYFLCILLRLRCAELTYSFARHCWLRLDS
jgi:hypothetical protein